MSRTINRVELLGRVGADPEMRYSQGGTAVTTLRLATDRRRQNGETEADWHSVVCWGKQAEAVAEYVKKGNRLFVAGSLAQNTSNVRTASAVHRTEVHAQEVVFLDSNGNGNGHTRERRGGARSSEQRAGRRLRAHALLAVTAPPPPVTRGRQHGAAPRRGGPALDLRGGSHEGNTVRSQLRDHRPARGAGGRLRPSQRALRLGGAA